MSEPTQQPNEAVEAPKANAEPLEAPEAPETPEDAPTDLEAALAELSETREKLAEATQRGDTFYEGLKLRTMEQAAGDVVRAISDMPADDPRYYDDAGFPSADGIRSVALELVESKPYLGHVRGDVHQGAKENTTVPTWSDIMRGALG